jgi:hypothetical protein
MKYQVLLLVITDRTGQVELWLDQPVGSWWQQIHLRFLAVRPQAQRAGRASAAPFGYSSMHLKLRPSASNLEWLEPPGACADKVMARR